MKYLFDCCNQYMNWPDLFAIWFFIYSFLYLYIYSFIYLLFFAAKLYGSVVQDRHTNLKNLNSDQTPKLLKMYYSKWENVYLRLFLQVLEPKYQNTFHIGRNV